MRSIRTRCSRSIVALAALLPAVLLGLRADAFAVGRADPGELDPSFGQNGTVVLTLGADSGFADIALSNGKPVVTGWRGSKILLMRFTPGGDPDPTFGGGDGKVLASFPNRAANGFDVAMAAGGKILVGSEPFVAGDAASENVGLIRFKANGAVDTTFGGGDGRVTTDMFGAEDQMEGMAVDSQGRIVVATESRKNGEFVPAVARYTPNGTLDHSFSGDGKFVIPTTASHPFIEALTVLPNDRIVVAGGGDPGVGTNQDFMLDRIKVGGGLDPAFGSGGEVFTDFDVNSEIADTLAVDPQGRIVAGGQATVNGAQKMALARYTTDGDPDTTFSGDGKVATDVGPDIDRLFGIALHGGKIVAVGRSDTAPGDQRWLIARYTGHGTLDSGFGVGGRTITNISSDVSKEEEAASVVVQDNGRVVVCGLVEPHPMLAGYVG